MYEKFIWKIILLKLYCLNIALDFHIQIIIYFSNLYFVSFIFHTQNYSCIAYILLVISYNLYAGKLSDFMEILNEIWKWIKVREQYLLAIQLMIIENCCGFYREFLNGYLCLFISKLSHRNTLATYFSRYFQIFFAK